MVDELMNDTRHSTYYTRLAPQSSISSRATRLRGPTTSFYNLQFADFHRNNPNNHRSKMEASEIYIQSLRRKIKNYHQNAGPTRMKRSIYVAYMRLAKELTQNGNLDDALLAYNFIIDAYTRDHKKMDYSITSLAATAYHGVGFIYEKRGQSELALSSYRTSLSTRRFGGEIVYLSLSDSGIAEIPTILDPNDLDASETLYRLGTVLASIQKYKEARPRHTACYHIRKTILGSEHCLVADSLLEMGVMNYNLGDFVEAFEFLQEANRIREFLAGAGEQQQMLSKTADEQDEVPGFLAPAA